MAHLASPAILLRLLTHGQTDRRRIHLQTCAQLYAYGNATSVRVRTGIFVVMAVLSRLLLSSSPPILSLPRSTGARARLTGRAAIHWGLDLPSFLPAPRCRSSEWRRRRRRRSSGCCGARGARLAPSIPGVQISSSAFSVGIISSIVCLHWKLRGANALICVREMEASFSFGDSLWSIGSFRGEHSVWISLPCRPSTRSSCQNCIVCP